MWKRGDSYGNADCSDTDNQGTLEAVKILKEANRKPSKESEKGAKKLAEIFDRMMK